LAKALLLARLSTPCFKMREKKLESALAFVLILLIISKVAHVPVLVSVAIVLGFLLGASSWMLDRFYFGWTKFLFASNFVVSRALLTLIYLLIFLPISLFVRNSSRKSIAITSAGKNSFLIKREKEYAPADFENPY
jgi:hypothetical protein